MYMAISEVIIATNFIFSSSLLKTSFQTPADKNFIADFNYITMA